MIATSSDTARLVMEPPRLRRRSLAAVTTPLQELAQSSPHFLTNNLGGFRHGNDFYSLARFIFNGPPNGGDPIRLGVFAGIHGDEPAGTLALARFLRDLAKNPELAAGYRIYAYPICNPTGFEDNTRHSRHGSQTLLGQPEERVNWHPRTATQGAVRV